MGFSLVGNAKGHVKSNGSSVLNDEDSLFISEAPKRETPRIRGEGPAIHQERTKQKKEDFGPETDIQWSAEDSEEEGSGANNIEALQQSVSPATGSYICYECQRPFLSAKSLCGHMRCHPNRKWRGLTPNSRGPTNVTPLRQMKRKKASGVTTLPPSRSKWRFSDSSVAARKHVTTPDPMDFACEEEEEAANTLLLLAKGSSRPDMIGVSLKGSDAALDGIDSNRANSSADFVAPHRSEFSEKEEENKVSAGKIPHKNVYICDVCSMVFSDYRALGGHRAGHNKVRSKGKDLAPPPKELEANFPSQWIVVNVQLKEAVAKHLCPHRKLDISSLRALDGHMGGHFAWPLEQHNAQMTDRTDIDLNELPKM